MRGAVSGNAVARREARFDLRQLVRAARGAARLRHAPYSEFPVGVAILDSAGSIWVGANIENAAYPLGCCAERVGLLRWRAALGPPIRALVIASDAEPPASPCGVCRDALLANCPEAVVYLSGSNVTLGPFRAAEWLPAAHGKALP
ncbi:MAG: cytidine deaminase [Candidatus Eisenbacteria bacterium]|nr:cytidine deaminase [Candidatus Eisenbacteria bacterium]